jgi:hypothetical protein
MSMILVDNSCYSSHYISHFVCSGKRNAKTDIVIYHEVPPYRKAGIGVISFSSTSVILLKSAAALTTFLKSSYLDNGA